MAMKRIFLIILDSFGIGNAPDAADFADEGSNTLRAVMLSQKFWVPNLKKLGLFEKVVNLKFGLDQKINDKTTFFSQSEKQLFALSRVILRNPKIIIFDSAFNSMSTRQKKKVFKIIQEFAKDKTCVFFSDPGAELPFECKEIKMKG